MMIPTIRSAYNNVAEPLIGIHGLETARSISGGIRVMTRTCREAYTVACATYIQL